MHKIKNIISLPVLSLYEGELIGQISKVFFDKKLKKVSHFLVSSDNDLNYVLLPKHIYKIGKNAITIKNSTYLTLEIDDSNARDVIPTPLDSKTYTIQGEYLGKIDQIIIDDKFFVNSIALDNSKMLNCAHLASCSKNTIIMYDENTSINVSRFKHRLTPKFFKSRAVTHVSTLPVPPSVENIQHEITLPTNATNNPKFMIGRIATQDIILEDKKILIKANSTITERILSLACTHNKLKELMLYSKQK